MAGLTAADVRGVAFGRPGFGKRGYDPAEVDAFLDSAAAALDAVAAGGAPTMTAADVQSVLFRKPPVGKRGYREDEVDDFLDRLAATLSGPGGSAGTTGIVLNGQPLQP